MPVLNLPPEFTINEINVDNRSAVATLRGNSTVIGVNGTTDGSGEGGGGGANNNVARMDIGFEFDDLPDLRNLSESHRYIHLELVKPRIKFDRVEPYYEFSAKSDTAAIHMTVSSSQTNNEPHTIRSICCRLEQCFRI